MECQWFVKRSGFIFERVFNMHVINDPRIADKSHVRTSFLGRSHVTDFVGMCHTAPAHFNNHNNTTIITATATTLPGPATNPITGNSKTAPASHLLEGDGMGYGRQG